MGREIREDRDESQKSDRYGGRDIAKGMDGKQREAELRSLSQQELMRSIAQDGT